MNNRTFAEKLAKNLTHYPQVTELRSCAPKLVEVLLALYFPHFRACENSSPHPITPLEIQAALTNIGDELLLQIQSLHVENASPIVQKFLDSLEQIHDDLLADAAAILRGDPAAKDIDEVIICYPGFYAIAVYRFAHALHLEGVPLLPRILTEYAHQKTGIDIHPGATISRGFCIDHGTGIVIGETSVIKENVRMYQGVTLGGLVISKELANKKRHPTIEEDVIIYANATILGGATVIGARSVIGGSVWLTTSIAPDSTVYHEAKVSVKAKRNSL